MMMSPSLSLSLSLSPGRAAAPSARASFRASPLLTTSPGRVRRAGKPGVARARADPPSWAGEEPGKTVHMLITSTDTELSDVVPKDYLANPYGKAFLDSLGMTTMAEKINGRLAMVGMVGSLLHIFQGDFLTQIAYYPLATATCAVVVNGASLIEICNPKGFLPGAVKDAAMKAYEGAGVEAVATEELERQHGRLAMLGVLGFTALSALL